MSQGNFSDFRSRKYRKMSQVDHTEDPALKYIAFLTQKSEKTQSSPKRDSITKISISKMFRNVLFKRKILSELEEYF